MKRSKARVLLAGWCSYIVIGNRSCVIIMGITYTFNIIIEISWAMSLTNFMKHTKLSNTYYIVYRKQSNLLKSLTEFS